MINRMDTYTENRVNPCNPYLKKKKNLRYQRNLRMNSEERHTLLFFISILYQFMDNQT